MKVRNIFIIITTLVIIVLGCKPDSYYKNTVVLNLTGWSYPDTVKVSTDFDLHLSTISHSSCTKKHNFVLEHIDTDVYKIYATGVYISYNNNCHEKIVETDTTITGSISEVGRYYFLFLNENVWKVDSIQVIP
ncbi:MAG TPA: hypothetical protein DIW31_07855 [Bacteroidales bacterium]|nr:hypothetical protein [Bacteroidales bacterium]